MFGDLLHALTWYVTAGVLSWLMYPLIYHALRSVPGRGLSLARPLGLLLAALPSWWLSAAGILPYTTPLVIAVPVVIGGVVWAVELRRGDLGAFLVANRRAVLAVEVAALALFAGYLAFRGFNSAIAYTEKPMESAFLASALRATTMPPADPWFSGGGINYYYLGYVIAALPARLADVPASTAFNLALAHLFASSAIAIAGTAMSVARAARPSSRATAVASLLLGPLFLVGIGNLVTPMRLIQDPDGTLGAGWWQGVGWQATRVIVDDIPGRGGPSQTINEFPAFSFILGDLHPHVLALPLLISLVALTFAVFARSPGVRAGRLTIALAGIVTGALYATNAWDTPVAAILVLGAIVLTPSPSGWTKRARRMALFAASALLTAAPFAASYTPPLGLPTEDIPAALREIPIVTRLIQTVGVVIWERSSLGELLLVHGLFLAVSVIVLAAARARLPADRRARPRHVALALVLLVAVALLLRFPAIVLFGVPLAGMTRLLLVGKAPTDVRFAAGLSALAYLLLLVPEIAFLQDPFANRMNTVFKLYFQAWMLLAVASAIALPRALATIRSSLGRGPTAVIVVPLALLVGGAAVYPPLSAYRWTNGFNDWQDLDGLAYLSNTAPDEKAAITWLRGRLEPDDRLLEAPGCSYGERAGLPSDRMSAYTGAPTVIGWEFHEVQWRSGTPAIRDQIAARQADANAIFRDPTSLEAARLLDEYGISYIIVGTFERGGYGTSCTAGPPYPPEALAAFDRLGWQRAFHQGAVTVYQRPGR